MYSSIALLISLSSVILTGRIAGSISMHFI